MKISPRFWCLRAWELPLGPQESVSRGKACRTSTILLSRGTQTYHSLRALRPHHLHHFGVTGVNQVQGERSSYCCSRLSSPRPPHLLPAAIRYAEGPPTPSAHGQEGSAPQQSVTACFLSPLSSCIVLDFSTALSPGILFIVGFILKRFQMTLPPPLG